jgi:hypothetical protein
MIFINEHEVRLDEGEGLLAWQPYDRVIWLALDFIRRCPTEARNGLPWYLTRSCFWTDPLRPAEWPDNPAGKAGMAANTLLRYYAYCGARWPLDVLQSMLDRLIAYHTPAHYAWPAVPYASAEPEFGVYTGARADGQQVIEPDKVAQAALGYLRFYQASGTEVYLQHARHCADVLADKVTAGDEQHSPWPFRVNAASGETVEAYCSQLIAALRLFDELIHLGLDEGGHYRRANDLSWDWLVRHPMQNGMWKGYFEDIRLDPENANRDQYSPLECARYLLQHQDRLPDTLAKAHELLEWVMQELAAEPFFKAIAIHEQRFCYHVMGSHTARFASLCALYGAASGDTAMIETARRAFNWATYMADENGWVRVGIDRPDYYNQCWFSDGYFDYVVHFLDGMDAVPAWAPEGRDHMLNSTAVVQAIDYQPGLIRFRTFEAPEKARLHLSFEPRQVWSGGQPLAAANPDLLAPGWHFDDGSRLLQINHAHPQVVISARQTEVAP